MAIKWTELCRERVEDVLKRYPPKSHACDKAARELLPIAREIDVRALSLSVRPRGKARYVVPKTDLGGRSWFMHFTVEVTQHCVDALTPADGTSKASYLDVHWNDPSFLVLAPEELPDVT